MNIRSAFAITNLSSEAQQTRIIKTAMNRKVIIRTRDHRRIF